MGLMSFIKEAGEKLFGGREAKAAEAAAPSADTVAALNKTAGDAIENYIETQGLKVDGLKVAFDGASSTATVEGTVADQATKEKVLLCCGNVAGVGKVNDMLVVNSPEVLWRRQQVPGHLRGQQADAQAPGQDLSGPDAAHSAAGLSRDRHRRRRAAPAARGVEDLPRALQAAAAVARNRRVVLQRFEVGHNTLPGGALDVAVRDAVAQADDHARSLRRMRIFRICPTSAQGHQLAIWLCR
jgi:hypothetical protein